MSARLADSAFFVIEADEYDTAFFDKRSKFVHYRPRTAILNNLEYDHADIFPDLAAIETQFHHLVRTVPRTGGSSSTPRRQASRACSRAAAGRRSNTSPARSWRRAEGTPTPAWRIALDGKVTHGSAPQGIVRWPADALQLGRHNRLNALAALAAARHAGVPVDVGLAALAGVPRRQAPARSRAATVRGITVYDDFAHHPTAIATTIDGLRRGARDARILAVLEPRSRHDEARRDEGSRCRQASPAPTACSATRRNLGWDVGGRARAARREGGRATTTSTRWSTRSPPKRAPAITCS